jgi:hypothetical protein
MLNPANNIIIIKNPAFCPLNEDEIKTSLEEQGIQWK